MKDKTPLDEAKLIADVKARFERYNTPEFALRMAVGDTLAEGRMSMELPHPRHQNDAHRAIKERLTAAVVKSHRAFRKRR